MDKNNKVIQRYDYVGAEKVALIHEYFHQGMRRSTIAKKLRIAPHLLNEFIIEKAFYYEKPIGFKNKVTEEEVDRAFHLKQYGYSEAKIAKELGRNEKTINKYLKQ